jgi:putative membrane protein
MIWSIVINREENRMKYLSSLKDEFLGIIKNKKMLIAIIGIFTIPVLYCGTFLWAFWDPYGNTDQLPVAVVNLDEGTTYHDETLNIGKDLVEKLNEKDSFEWHFVSQEEADRGLENQQYYIKIEIPADFSENAATIQEEHPDHLKLIYTPNEGYNYLSSMIGNSAIEKIKEEISTTVTKTYAESMLKNVENVAIGLKEASDGAGQISDGMKEAASGSEQLTTGIYSARTGVEQLQDGTNSMYEGTSELEKNLSLLAGKSVVFSNGIESAASGSKDLNNGLQQLNGGMIELTKGQTALLQGASATEKGTESLKNGISNSLTGFNQLQEKLPAFASGVNALADGTDQLLGSLQSLNSTTTTAVEQSTSVKNGISDAINQLSLLANTTSDQNQKQQIETILKNLQTTYEEGQTLAVENELINQTTTKIAESGKGLSEGAENIRSSEAKLEEAIGQLSAGQEALYAGASQLQEGQAQVVNGLSVFSDKMNLASDGLGSLSNGSYELTNGLNQLSEGSSQLEQGAYQLSEGSKQLLTGAGQLAQGTNELNSGMKELANGSSTVTNGLEQLTDGTSELKDSLSNGAEEAENVKANDTVYEMFAKPVQLQEERLNTVPNYGTGFAPYFLPLSLYVGALMLSVIFPLRDPASPPRNGLNWFLGKMGVLAVVGIVQAILADAVLLQILGLEVKSIPLFVGLSILTSWTFLAIIQFLVAAFENPGRFIGIILLILQLTSSAGTYPIELVPTILQHINPYLPMTYAISAFRAVVSTGDQTLIWHNISCLSIFLVVFLVASLCFYHLKFKKLQYVFGHDTQDAVAK